MSNGQASKKADPEKDELSPVPGGPVSATVPSGQSAAIAKEASKEKPTSFEEIQALIELAERLQASVDAKKQRLAVVALCRSLIIFIVFALALSCGWLLNGLTTAMTSLSPDQRTILFIVAGGSLTFLSLVMFNRALSGIERRIEESLERDQKALTDVADMLREAGDALGKDLSPLGRFLLRVQTFRLDIGVNPGPNTPRMPGHRPSHLPPEDASGKSHGQKP